MRFALAAALLGMLLLAPSAEAYERLNYRWPSKTILYHDATGKQYSKNVAAAAAAWNKSGQKARWKKTSKKKARVQIRVSKKIPSAGLATYYGGQRGLIQIQPGMKKMRESKAEGEWVATTIMTHEMGHIMGLDHETKKCAVMQPAIGIGCPNAKDAWQYRCRVLEPDDVRGGVALFGGKIGKVGPEYCDRSPAPGTPTDVQAILVDAVPDDFDDELGSAAGVRVSWTNPTVGEPLEIRVMRRQDACPKGVNDKAAKEVGYADVEAGLPGSVVDATGFPGSGSYCYAVFAIGPFNRPSAPATAVYQHTGGASQGYRPSVSFYPSVLSDDGAEYAFEDYSEAGQDAELVSWHWDFGDGATASDRNPTHRFAPREEPYTVTLTVTDDKGQTATAKDEIYVLPPIDHGDLER